MEEKTLESLNLSASSPTRASSRTAVKKSERKSLSKFLNTGVRQQSKKNTGGNLDISSGACRRSSNSQTKQFTEGVGQNSATNPAWFLPSQKPPSSSSVAIPNIAISLPSTSTPNSSPPPKSSSLPSDLAAVPPDWQYSDPSDISSRASLVLVSRENSPTRSEGSRPTTPHPRSRSRSPLLGISSLRVKRGSQLSLDWDNYSCNPSYFKIPVVNTPSPSSISSFDTSQQASTPISVIMVVKRCSKCHRYISGAPSQDLEHSGPFGPDCTGEHHPNPCNYVHKEDGACSFYSGDIDIQDETSTGANVQGGNQSVQNMSGFNQQSGPMQETKELLFSMNKE